MLRGPVKQTMEMVAHCAVCTLFERHGSGGNRNTLLSIGKRNEGGKNEPEFHQSDGAIKYLGIGYLLS